MLRVTQSDLVKVIKVGVIDVIASALNFDVTPAIFTGCHKMPMNGAPVHCKHNSSSPCCILLQSQPLHRLRDSTLCWLDTYVRPRCVSDLHLDMMATMVDKQGEA